MASLISATAQNHTDIAQSNFIQGLFADQVLVSLPEFLANMDFSWMVDFLKGMVKPLAATVVVFLAVALSYVEKLGLGREMIYSICRAFVQLSIIGFVLQFIFTRDNAVWIVLAYLFMVTVAGYTAGQRAKHVPRGKYVAGASILAGTSITMFLLLVMRVFPFTPRYIIPVAGMMVGNSMTVTGVTMKRLRDDIRTQMNLVETALALGATPRQATMQQVKRALVISLSPVLDNAKTVGLISLPGAMTGLIMGGASPLEAIQLQIVVMNFMIGATTVSSISSTYLCWRRGMIENVYQRSSEILDPPVANVDHLLVLFSMEQPKLEPFALTRFLIEAESTGIPLTLALNKSELVDEEAKAAWKFRLHKWGYKPVFCSVESKHGLDSLAFILRDQTSVIVGPSGVGKSSLINALRSNHHASDAAEGESLFDPILGSKWYGDQLVGQVSTRSGRGKHTTRNVSLLPLSNGGYLADTPGFNQPSLTKVTKQSLAQTFPEIRKMLSDSEPAKCSFNDCLHLGEPGCVVSADWERYPYYFQLLDEIRIREEFQLRTYGTKKEGDVRYKAGDKGVQQAEPRLELKKHRRVSRKSMNQSLLDELDELDDDDNLLDEENDPFLKAMRDESQ